MNRNHTSRRGPLRQPDAEVSAGVQALRYAFRQGPTPEAAALLLHELDAGLSWELATQAVADATAERFGSAVPATHTLGAPPRTRARGVAPSRLLVFLRGALFGRR